MDKDPEINIENVIKHLNKKWEYSPCPMCGSVNWLISENVFELREYHGGDVLMGSGSIFPVVPVSCNDCGTSIFVNAVIAGAFDFQEDETNKPHDK